MRHHGLEIDAAVRQSAREGEAGAGGRQRLEAERGEEFGRADIPGVGDDEGLRALVQLAEAGGFSYRHFHLLRRPVLSDDEASSARRPLPVKMLVLGQAPSAAMP
jgi:hypothetical protein